MHPQLRAPQHADATWLLAALNDAQTNHALVDLPHPYPKSFVPEFWLDDTQPLLQFVWLYNQQPIGYIWCAVSDNDDNADQNAELSFLLHRNLLGQGLGLAQLPHIFKWLAPHMQQNFSTTNISAHVRPSNMAAQAVLGACGFELAVTAAHSTLHGQDLLQTWQFNY